MLTKGKAQPLERPKRFYKTASAAALDGGFAVMLDGRPVRTPAGSKLVLPTLALAALAAEEWAAQGKEIVLADMPATRLAHTAVDRVPQAHAAVAEETASYAGSDVLCYFADGPDVLVSREQAEWEPWLDWAEQELGLRFVRVTGVIHQAQPQATLERALELTLDLDDFRLTALATATALLGSLVLAFAMERGRLSGEAAFGLSRLDEIFQQERWGVDAEAAERTERMLAECLVLERWFAALG
jgi:chaperone required for assembly of F1-ATPase